MSARKKNKGNGSSHHEPVTMKRIAQETDLDLSTVSRILRGIDHCADDTRARVLETAKKLGYRPNLLVRGLQTGKTQMIGVMLYPGLFNNEILIGIHDELLKYDYAPLTLWSDRMTVLDKGVTAVDRVCHMLDRRVDGMIIVPSEEQIANLYMSQIWGHGVPLVVVDRPLPNVDCDFVGSDNASGVRQVAEHLHRMGHRRVGLLPGIEGNKNNLERERGFQAIWKEMGGECHSIGPQKTQFHIDEGVERLMAMNPRPTAFFASSDPSAMAVYRVVRLHNLNIPKDVSVVGYADLLFSKLLAPPLTTVRQSPEKMGAIAARMVLDRIEGKYDGPIRKELAEQTLIVRNSTSSL